MQKIISFKYIPDKPLGKGDKESCAKEKEIGEWQNSARSHRPQPYGMPV